jgi:UDP-N-acetylglucosamine 2-epimerase (non-hydrolysing)
MSSETRCVMTVAGARPNFMKIAPIARELLKSPDQWRHVLVHTGQHYDDAMSNVFFRELGIPEPDVNLNVGSASHAVQTAAVMTAFERVVVSTRPDVVVVVGDVNSTLACALVSAKLGIAVAHVEAGLRSFDRTMPEEINRVVTDHLSDLLFVTERSGTENLLREGIPRERVHFVGNVMIDTLLAHRARARELRTWVRFGLERGHYVVLTLHRPANVDDIAHLRPIMEAISEIAVQLPVIFPVHPRTRERLRQYSTIQDTAAAGRLILIDPQGYLDFLSLMEASSVVLTDSGGIQEETTILGIPCLTLRSNTERPATVESGTNRIVGTTRSAILEAFNDARRDRALPKVPPLWDGAAAARIVSVLSAEVPRATAGAPQS